MKVRRKMLLAIALATVFRANVSARAEELNPGAVVEKIAKNSQAEKTGIQEGDLLLHWVRGDAKGEIESPFDLSQVETEQAPRGAVTLEGLRGTEKQSWTLGPSSWGITARPDFSDSLLASYRAGQDLAKADKLKEAAERWQQASKQIDNSQPAWLRVWFLSHPADLFAGTNQWQEAGNSYQDAVQAGAAGPAISAQLLRSLAFTYQKRNDWANAEKYYQQAITESRKLNPESLTIGAILNELGRIADFRGDLAKAEEILRQGLEMREKLAPESLDVAWSINNLAVVASKKGDTAKAEEYFRRALAIREKLSPGSLEVAASLNNLGVFAWRAGDLPKAEDYYYQSLAIKEKLAPGSLDVQYTLNGLGAIASQRAELAKAEDYFRRALVISEKLAPGSLNLGTNLTNLGFVDWLRGDSAKAEEYYLQALTIEEKVAPESLDVAGLLMNLGDLDLDRGDLTKAEESYRHSFSIREKLAPESIDAAMSLDNLGNLAFQQGDLAKAEQYYGQDLAIKEKLAPASLYVAVVLNELGDVAQTRHDLSKAEDYYQQALSLREKLAPGGLDVAQSDNSLGDAFSKQGDLVKAEDYYRQALAVREKLAPQSKEHAETLAALAGIMRRKQQPEAAAQLFEQALNTLESQTAQLGGSEEVRAGFRAKRESYYKDYVDLLIAQKQPEKAFQVLERSRARTLLETLAAAHVDIRKGGDPALLEQEHSLHELIVAKSNRRIELLTDKDAKVELAAIDQELKGLLPQYEDVKGRIRSSSPAYAALTQPQPLSAKEVQQQLLDPNTLLLEYSLGEERSYVFVVSSGSVSAYELPKRAEIEAAARQVYDILVARSHSLKGESDVQRMLRSAKAEAQYPKVATILGRMILGPVASLLEGKRLLIVSDGILQYVPFTALPSPEAAQGFTPLVASHEIVNLPSASVLQVLQRESAGRARPAKMIAVLADPVFARDDKRVTGVGIKQIKMPNQENQGGSEASDSLPEAILLRSATDVGVADGEIHFPRLLFTRNEADLILKQAPAGKSMRAVDFQASRATATSPELAQYRIIHFATHGLLNSEHPELSGLVLSLVDEHGRRQDGFLQLTDIYNLNLPADMVVLSACETGLGKEIKGEGLLGITRGFMYAGASRVLASLWNVDDAATAHLMGTFYKGIFKDNLQPAAALQRAQVEMWKQKRWSSPYYWAGFVLQGQW